MGVLGVAIASGGQAIAGEGGARGLPVALAVAGVGACSTIGIAANGRLGVRLGEPLVAAFITLLVALAFSAGLAAAAILASGSGIRSPWDAPLVAWTGGALGAVWVSASVALVRRLGVLVLLVGAMTGQVLGSIALDVAAPLGDGTVDPARLAGVAVMAVALVLASAGSRLRS
jgi:transporter family-2 protein